MFDRRRMLKALGLGGFFGGATAAVASPVPDKLPQSGGVIIFWVNVGLLPPFKAEAYAKKMTENLGPCPEGWQRYVMHVRPPETSRVEVFFPGQDKSEAEKIVARMKHVDLVSEMEEGYWDKLKQETVDYVLVMLGAPAVPIPLPRSSIELYWDSACQWFDRLLAEEQDCSLYQYSHVPDEGLKDLTLGYAMVSFGRIALRKEPTNSSGNELLSQINGEMMIREGKKTIERTKAIYRDRYGRPE